MNKYNSLEIDKANFTEQTKFRLNEISKIENYFNQEISQRKSCSKKLSKYAIGFDYIDKINCFKCNKQWSMYYFFCECCWSLNWKSRSKFYSNFFSNNRNNQKITEQNKKQK